MWEYPCTRDLNFFFLCKTNACEHADGIPQFMDSPQCLGHSRYRTVTRDFCFPPKQGILNRTEQAAKNHGVKSVFLATDNDPMLEELNFRLKGMNVSTVCLSENTMKIAFL